MWCHMTCHVTWPYKHEPALISETVRDSMRQTQIVIPYTVISQISKCSKNSIFLNITFSVETIRDRQRPTKSNNYKNLITMAQKPIYTWQSLVYTTYTNIL